MKLTIPTDEQLGKHIESIVRVIVIAIAVIYAAGFTCGTIIHWLSANLTTLHHHLLVDENQHADANPAVSHSDTNNRVNPKRTRSRTSTKRGTT